MQVSVVNSYEAHSLAVVVTVLRRVDYKIQKFSVKSIASWFESKPQKHPTTHPFSRTFPFTFPTDGKPMRATLASPDLSTSNPSPSFDFLEGVNSSERYLANFALRTPKWYSVAKKTLEISHSYFKLNQPSTFAERKYTLNTIKTQVYLCFSASEQSPSRFRISFQEFPFLN